MRLSFVNSFHSCHLLVVVYLGSWDTEKAAATKHNVSIFAITKTWLTKADHFPGTAGQSFCIYLQNSNIEYQLSKVAIPILRVTKHVQYQVKLCIRNVKVCAVMLQLLTERIDLTCLYKAPGTGQEKGALLLNAVTYVG